MTAVAVVLTALAGLSGAISVTALLLVRQSVSGFGDALRQPRWMWLGGLAGAFIVFTVTWVAPRIGAFATTGVFLAAQLAMAVVIDRFGLFGLNRIGLGWTRIAGLALLAAGAALTLHRA